MAILVHPTGNSPSSSVGGEQALPHVSWSSCSMALGGHWCRGRVTIDSSGSRGGMVCMWVMVVCGCLCAVVARLVWVSVALRAVFS